MRMDMVNTIINDLNTKNENLQVNSSKDNTKNSEGTDFSKLLKNIKSDNTDSNSTKISTDKITVDKMKNKPKEVENKRKVENKNKGIKEVGEKQVDEDIDEKIDNLSNEQIIQCLSTIIDKVQEILNSGDKNIDSSSIESINLELKEAVLSSIKCNEDNKLQNNFDFNKFTATIQNSAEKDNPINVVNNILEMLNKNNVSEILDKDNLSLANSLLNNLSTNLENEDVSNSENSFLKNLVLEVKKEIGTLLAQNDNQQNINTNKFMDIPTNKIVDIQDNELEKENAVLNSYVEKTNKVENNAPTVSNVNNQVGDKNLNIKNELQYDEKGIVNNNSDKKSSSENSNSEDSHSNFSKDEKILNSILKGSNTSNKNSFVMPVTTTIVQNNGGMSITEVQVISKDSMVADVIKTVKFMTNNTMKEMVVKINPENLGEVTIKLIEENGIMKMNIKASSKETYSLLSQQANEMKNQLNDQNIKIQDVNISLYEDDTTFFKEGGFNNNSFQENKRKNDGNRFNDEDSNDEQDNATNNTDTSAINMLA